MAVEKVNKGTIPISRQDRPRHQHRRPINPLSWLSFTDWKIQLSHSLHSIHRVYSALLTAQQCAASSCQDCWTRNMNPSDWSGQIEGRGLQSRIPVSHRVTSLLVVLIATFFPPSSVTCEHIPWRTVFSLSNSIMMFYIFIWQQRFIDKYK